MKNNLADMMCLEIYLSSLSNKKYEKIKHKIGTPKSKPMPLMSWDIYIEGYQKKILTAKKENDFKKVSALAKEFNWKNDLNLAFSESDYEALIITDKNQHIIWVNEGFTLMTGYSKKEALNRKPAFLQGEETSLTTKNRIKEKIIQNKPFKEVIVNYKKDKTTYTCEVKILPLYNEQTTHFIAFEKQII